MERPENTYEDNFKDGLSEAEMARLMKSATAAGYAARREAREATARNNREVSAARGAGHGAEAWDGVEAHAALGEVFALLGANRLRGEAVAQIMAKVREYGEAKYDRGMSDGRIGEQKLRRMLGED